MEIDIEQMLRFDEGEKFTAYICTGGYLTCGIGHNLDADPATDILKRTIKLGGKITPVESAALFKRDLDRVIYQLTTKLNGYEKMKPKYQVVLINMCFQLGFGGLLKFKNTLAAMRADKKDLVISNMKSSRWYSQTPNRVDRLISVIEGKIPSEYMKK